MDMLISLILVIIHRCVYIYISKHVVCLKYIHNFVKTKYLKDSFLFNTDKIKNITYYQCT